MEALCRCTDDDIHLHGELRILPASYKIGVMRLLMKIVPTMVMEDDGSVFDVFFPSRGIIVPGCVNTLGMFGRREPYIWSIVSDDDGAFSVILPHVGIFL